MNRDNFELTVDNNMLTLRGERKFEKKADGNNYHRVERSYGLFTRSFTLPQSVSPDDVNAEYKNGVLRVTLQKRDEVRAKRIEISGGDADENRLQTIETQTTSTATPEAAKKAAK